MKKIKISANYDSSENLTNRLLRQYKTPEIDLSNINFSPPIINSSHMK